MSSKTAAAQKRKEQKMRPEQEPGPDELLAAAQFGNLGAVERLEALERLLLVSGQLEQFQF